MEANIREATKHDAAIIGGAVRKEDMDEIIATSFEHPYFAMLKGMENSPASVFEIDGLPICMFGVAPGGMIGNVGVPWMIGSDKLDFFSRPFLKRSRPVVLAMSEKYDMLLNYVDARNIRAIQWLKWCGFTIDEAKPYTQIGLPFHKFWMKKEQPHV